MTGAGRLSSDLQPIMARAAPLCLSYIVSPTPAAKTPTRTHDIQPRRSFRQGWKPAG
ncbi:hypothetical protein ACVIHI_000517 [Bradyrhizobium sp. USDA 4524]|nr:hypothetical protein [Bradyrhizobium sp. USDA 4538]MCP1898677.1 hypothetical protein [Bradyrhizobium sp. USDA 4537]MCP1909176.1 hypothetical protein [Bradyrhizobium elkanii]MCP1987212.1 hypothetical protein [Bradyrhizobium sp. USDA 4539]